MGTTVEDATAGGRGRSFELFARPHVAAMTWLAARLAPEHYEDVVQNALLHAWRKADRYDPGRGSPRTWLLALVAEQARQRPRTPVEIGPREVAATEHVEVRLDLQRAIGTLTERQQLAIASYYYVGLTVSDTAQVMGCSVGTVKSTLHDARTRLRTRLEDDGGQ